VHQLAQVGAESVSVLLQEAARVVENNPGEVLQAERRVQVRFWLQITSALLMLPVDLAQHGLVRALFTNIYIISQMAYKKFDSTFGNLLSSSIKLIMDIGLAAIMSRMCWLSWNSKCFQLMPSAAYASCSNLKMCCTKNCCSVSFA
jgi:hypothetical protein